MAIKIDRGNI